MLHTHPYPPFFPKNVTKLIVGTLPPPRFTLGTLKPGDVDFCYGSISGLLWKVLDRIFELNLQFETTAVAIQQRKDFLTSRGIGICDIVHSCQRTKIDASDLGMQDIQLRDVIGYIRQYPMVDTLLFTGGNSKNGPEYLFRKHLQTYDIPLTVVSDTIPRIHQFTVDTRVVQTVSLTAPSGAANRSIGSLPAYKALKQQDPAFNTMDFRVLQYRPFF